MVVNTGIKANPKFIEILSSVIGQMSDGIWENTRSMEKYWKNLSFETSSEGTIVLMDRYGVCANVRDFFANKIKQIIKIEIEDGNDSLVWSRTCSAQPAYIGYGSSITVGDCYELYELLKGRNTGKNSYSSYKPYKVILSYEGMSVNFEVEALSERQAKELAIKQLASKITARVETK